LNIVEAPPADPFAGVDFRTMTATPHVTLFEALRARSIRRIELSSIPVVADSAPTIPMTKRLHNTAMRILPTTKASRPATKSDPRIKGIYIRPNGQGTVSMAVLEELRAAILDFQRLEQGHVGRGSHRTEIDAGERIGGRRLDDVLRKVERPTCPCSRRCARSMPPRAIPASRESISGPTGRVRSRWPC